MSNKTVFLTSIFFTVKSLLSSLLWLFLKESSVKSAARVEGWGKRRKKKESVSQSLTEIFKKELFASVEIFFGIKKLPKICKSNESTVPSLETQTPQTP